MNAIARNSITQQCRAVLHKRDGCRRSIHYAISSTIDGCGGSSRSSGSSPQERSVAIASYRPPFTSHPSVMAKDIELLLCNIGVSRRCSLHTIENIIQQSSRHCNEDDIDNHDAANMIDIIAQIRSI